MHTGNKISQIVNYFCKIKQWILFMEWYDKINGNKIYELSVEKINLSY